MPKHLEIEKKTQAISMLCEGNSIRAVERMTGIHRDTIMRLAVRVGEGMAKVQSDMFRKLTCNLIEVDEIWAFVGAKQATVKTAGLQAKGYGDIWTWIALDAETKLVPCFHVGNRTPADANLFMSDLAGRLVNRPQISSDAFNAYRNAVEIAFGAKVDYASIVKTFGQADLENARRYSPPVVVGIEKKVIKGNPDQSKISTSYVEKQNHTLRMHCRRLARLTNAFSKKRENFAAAVSLHYAYYNLVKRHTTLRVTPAMQAGVTPWFWTVRDLVENGEAHA